MHTCNHNFRIEVTPLKPVYCLLELRVRPLVGQVSSMNQNVTWREFGRLIMRVGYADYACLARSTLLRRETRSCGRHPVPSLYKRRQCVCVNVNIKVRPTVGVA